MTGMHVPHQQHGHTLKALASKPCGPPPRKPGLSTFACLLALYPLLYGQPAKAQPAKAAPAKAAPAKAAPAKAAPAKAAPAKAAPSHSPTDGSASPLPDSTLLACLGGRVQWSASSGASGSTTTGHGIVLSLSEKQLHLRNDDGTKRSIARAELRSLKLLEAPPLSQLELRNALNKNVWVKLRNGDVHRGQLIAYDSRSLTLLASNDQPNSLGRGQVEELKTQAAQRHYGINLSLLPGIMLDMDRGLFRGYVNGALALPAALDGKLWGFSTGLGVGLPVVPSSSTFKLDILANANVMSVASACSACNYPTAHIFGFGLAVGFHDTLSNGFTYGITVPIMGYSIAPNYVGTTNAHVGHYFLSSAVSMPLGFVGYRL